MCTLASYHVNMGKAENDKIRRDDHFYKADGLLRAAELIKQKANGEEPEQAPVVGRAHLELAKGNLAAAEKLVDAARSLKDGGAGNVLPLLMKARLLYDRGQFAEALQWYRRALRSQGAAAPAGVRLGIGACQYQLGNFEGARLAFERTIQLEPTNVDALVGLASVEFNAASAVPAELTHGDGGGADGPSVEEKLADAKTNYVAAVKRGLELLERAFTLDPHHPGAQVELAKHFLYAGDDNLQAIEQLTETLIRGGADAIGSTPRLRAQAAMTRAKAHHSRGELQRAQGLYQAAAQMDETFHEPNFGLAQVALTRGDNKAALTYAERAYAAFPNSVEVQRVYGHCRRIADDAAAAFGGGGVASVGNIGAGPGRDLETAGILKKAVEADPYDYDAQIEHGDALLAAREYEAALAAYEGAVEILNNGGKKADGTSTISSSLLNNVGVLKAMTKGAAGHEDTRAVFLAALEAAAKEEGGKGEKGEALDEPAERRKATGARLQVAFNLARLSEEKGDIEDATARYDDLLVASPEMTECLLRKAAMAAKRENFAAAEQFARKALETKPDDPDAMASVGHVLMKQSRWSEAQAQFKALRNLPKKLTPTQAALSAAAGKDPNAATHQHDEYAMLSLANAAYYQAVKLQSSVNHKRGDPKVREAEQAHLDYATTLYTKALQKNCSDMYAANGLGILLAEKGRIDEAKATFQMVAEGITAATGKGAEGAADSSLMSSPDIWINQGHVQMAKGNYVAAAKHYEQAQAQFFNNLDHRVSLYQARNSYEAASLEESKSFLRRALHVAPWNHRLRFNLAYVLQENAHRTLNRTLKGAEKGKAAPGGGEGTEGTGRLQQVLNAIEEFKLALSLFEQLQKVASASSKDKDAKKDAPEYGFDKKRVGIHVSFCAEALKSAQPHLEAAEREEAALQARRDAQAAARRAAEETRAAQNAAKEAAEELKRKAAEAAAAAAAERFKQSQEQWLKKTTEIREAEEAIEGGGGKRKKSKKGEKTTSLHYDEDDDDILLPDDHPDNPLNKDKKKKLTDEQKAALKAAGLDDSDDDSEDEPEAKDTDGDDDEKDLTEDAKAKLKAAGLGDSDSDSDDEMPDAPTEGKEKRASPPKEETKRGRGGKRKTKEEERQEKANAAMKKLAKKAAAKKKKRGRDGSPEKEEEEEKGAAPAVEEKEEDADEEAPKKRRKAVIDDDDDSD